MKSNEWEASFVAILKHIAVKNSEYRQIQQYQLFQRGRQIGSSAVIEVKT